MKICLYSLFLLLLEMSAWAGDASQGVFIRQLTLPSGQVIVVAEGEGEPRSIGSYSVRLYAGQSTEYPLDDFLAGTVRKREGFVEKVASRDLDNNGYPELIVTVRSVGSGSYLSADAFAVSGGTLALAATVSGLPPGEDPLLRLTEKLKGTGNGGNVRKAGSLCGKALAAGQAHLPAAGEKTTLARIRQICTDYDLPELWAKIEKDPPPQPFASDGCSLWFKSWQGVDLYPACFLHDLKYWSGYPDEDVARLIADAELMIDVACLLHSTVMAEAMFQGTRLGGHEGYNQSFSWGFGRTR